MPKALIWSMAVVACLAGAPFARADDPWENGDDSNQTINLLRHGAGQFGHDLEGTLGNLDRDWFVVATKARHSYEARAGSFFWQSECSLPSSCGALLARVNGAGVVLTDGVAGSEDTPIGAGSVGRTVRWIEPAGSADYLLASALSAGNANLYDVGFYDTTLFVPRWNNTATQTTVLFLQNTTNVVLTGSLYFHDGGGTLLATVPVSVPQHGLQVVSTASVPALSGQSGSAQIAQLGGYGALVGKAVALEPGTGFTFDTAIVPLAR